jgi:competence protein ComEC
MFANRLRELFDNKESALALGYLVGEKGEMSEDMQNMIRAVGLSHMVVVSGFHLALVVEWGKRLLGKISRIAVILGAIILILFFISIAGMSASMMRAGLMTVLSIIAWYFGRKFHPARLLLYVATFSLITAPRQIFGVAWQLSFASYAGIVFVSPMLTQFLYGKRHRPGFIATNIIASISAQICCLPISIFNFGSFSMVGIVAVLLISPTVPFIMLLASVSAFIEPVKYLAKLLIDFNLFVISILSENSWIVFDVPPNNPFIFLLYLPIILGFFWLKHHIKYDFRPRYTLDKSRKYGKIYTC